VVDVHELENVLHREKGDESVPSEVLDVDLLVLSLDWKEGESCKCLWMGRQREFLPEMTLLSSSVIG
jgi:hypothetical protein